MATRACCGGFPHACELRSFDRVMRSCRDRDYIYMINCLFINQDGRLSSRSAPPSSRMSSSRTLIGNHYPRPDFSVLGQTTHEHFLSHPVLFLGWLPARSLARSDDEPLRCPAAPVLAPTRTSRGRLGTVPQGGVSGSSPEEAGRALPADRRRHMEPMP